MTDGQPRIEWLDDSNVVVDGASFLVSEHQDVYSSEVSTSQQFLVVKAPDYLRACVDKFRQLKPRNLLELGVWHGGSVVFWNLVLRPERHLAIDLHDRDVTPLKEFEANRQAHGRLAVRFGIDQADEGALNAVLDEMFGDELLDIAIDDASHSYFESRTSFEKIFPRMRAGGVYVVENWAWAHMPGQPTDVAGLSREHPALSNLIVEIMLICAARSGIVDDVTIEPFAVHVRRGSAAIEGGFRLTRHYSNRGIPYRPLL